MELNANKCSAEQREKSLELLVKSFEQDPYNPLTLKYMADHYFFVKEYSQCEQLCRRGLRLLEVKDAQDSGQGVITKAASLGDYDFFRKDIEHLRSDFYFILGKVYHVNEKQ
jgi:hypothetical protein